jgi:hypothetical protein
MPHKVKFFSIEGFLSFYLSPIQTQRFVPYATLEPRFKVRIYNFLGYIFNAMIKHTRSETMSKSIANHCKPLYLHGDTVMVIVITDNTALETSDWKTKQKRRHPHLTPSLSR